jgi:ABC-type multidrug transport system fused ATPase/permease subunit
VPVGEWRERITIVRQDPFIFNDTLRYNLTIGNRDVSQEDLDEVTRIAKVDEFFEELPNGTRRDSETVVFDCPAGRNSRSTSRERC